MSHSDVCMYFFSGIDFMMEKFNFRLKMGDGIMESFCEKKLPQITTLFSFEW